MICIMHSIKTFKTMKKMKNSGLLTAAYNNIIPSKIVSKTVHIPLEIVCK